MPENFRLLKQVLSKLDDAGCLKHVILAGSWASYFYAHYYKSPKYRPLIRTTDIDFLIGDRRKLDASLDLNIGDLLEELGFVKLNHPNGLMKYESKDLTVEFLVPDIGRGINKPVKIKGLNTTAQALRFMNMLTEDPLVVDYEGMKIRVPDPVAYAFHKLIISERRTKNDKQKRDYRTAIELMEFLKSQGMERNLLSYFNSMPKGWRKKVQSSLKADGDSDILPF